MVIPKANINDVHFARNSVFATLSRLTQSSDMQASPIAVLAILLLVRRKADEETMVWR